ncbi:YcxB family protein [Leptospira bandrabouensis]|uniref:YcxB family protein n=1 Tax=Leptospira bandrabouensis TaxID=2484903 RepID=UPI001EE99FB1|nr:YcxB family protein [Leptospira bandrabouensis]MCG6144545.1 YcxB family protein [Leptospira bandrabouensis]MCG6160206.1 YcxB family protein [Leptospira bandrabouensis]MCG6164139.1 YcxB family protein [Leptospira bandrabouensis]
MTEIKYIQKLEDLSSFSSHHHNFFGSRYQKYYPEIFLSITTIISVVIFFSTYPKEINIFALLYLFLNLLYYVYLRLTRKRKLIKYFNKFYTEGREFIESELTILFEDSFILTQSKNVESKIPYENLVRLSIGTEAIYIYISNIQALILPNRIFHSPSDSQAIIDFLIQKNGNLIYP